MTDLALQREWEDAYWDERAAEAWEDQHDEAMFLAAQEWDAWEDDLEWPDLFEYEPPF